MKETTSVHSTEGRKAIEQKTHHGAATDESGRPIKLSGSIPIMKKYEV